MIKRLLVATACAAAALILGSCQKDAVEPNVAASSAIDGDYLTSGGDGSNWAMTGFNYDEQRHSPLTKINDSNVQDLGIAWFADLPDARGQEATPVIVDGKMFVSTAWSKVFAFDAKNGKPLWNFDPEVDKARGVKACCDVVNRGIAFWKGSVFVGTIDGRLISLDAATGKQNWSVQTLDIKSNGTITGVPRVVKDKVVIGFGGAEFGARGYVTAYDADTGKQAWRFYTTPNPKGEPDNAASDEILKTAATSTWSAKPKRATGVKAGAAELSGTQSFMMPNLTSFIWASAMAIPGTMAFAPMAKATIFSCRPLSR